MIATVTEADLPELLVLMRAYCNFYKVAPADEQLLSMSRTLIADPACEGIQFIARADDGTAVGFATVFWAWSTLSASRIGIMNDLFVTSSARGGRIGEALIRACRERCRDHGATSLGWQTAKSNERAQRLYDRIGGERSEWLDYSLEV